MGKIRIAILSGGPSAEHEVSINSAKNVTSNLDFKKYDISEIVISKKGSWNIKGNVYDETEAINYLKINTDLVFIILHGEYGEDGTLQKKLEEVNIKYTGSDSSSSALAMDKAESSVVLESSGLLIPKFKNFNKEEWIGNKEDIIKKIKLISDKVVIKPTDRGSSVGTTILKDSSKIESAVEASLLISDNCMAQEFIEGKELTCGVLEKPDGETVSLTPTEIIPNKDLKFFDYTAKYTVGASQELTPPNEDDKTIKLIQQSAIKAHHALGCRHFSRTDFILKNNELYTLEVNTIPGLTKTSLLPQGAKAAGIGFSELLDVIINAAL